MPGFGWRTAQRYYEEETDYTAQLCKRVNGHVVDPITTQLLNLEVYDQEFGLFDHLADSYKPPIEQHPLSLVRMHPQEDVMGYSRLYRMAYRFVRHGMHEKTGLNFIEFISLPRHLTEHLFRVSAHRASAETTHVEKSLEELKKRSN